MTYQAYATIFIIEMDFKNGRVLLANHMESGKMNTLSKYPKTSKINKIELDHILLAGTCYYWYRA